ncbi:MAG TPA: VWA domain-containing protein [Streptosporangiaceae bacterium]|nr:VWA domain-containing protein [Streptosporangiaceae bacterium]
MSERAEERERLRRWRLLLGAPAGPGLGFGAGAGAGSGGGAGADAGGGVAADAGGGAGDGAGAAGGAGAGNGTGAGGNLSQTDRAVDAALAALYDAGRRPGDQGPRGAGLNASAPRVARWLGDIRTYFPASVAAVMQRDAVDRLNLRQLLLEPELLGSVEPDVHLVGTLLSLNRIMPETTKATARQVVRAVVAEVERRIANRTRSAVSGALNRAARTRRPKQRDIDWNRTIAANLSRYLPEHRTVVPERLVGYGRRQQVVARDVVLAIDQSGSMASSVVYASVFGAVLASIRALKTSLVVFDTAVVDLTEKLHDPVDVLFGTQLGGGTDINKAIAYSQTLITRPRDSIFVLISDLLEGGVREQMLARIAALHEQGTAVVVLLALSDDGAPAFDTANAAALAEIGVPAFACTPDAFPDLLAVAIAGGDVGAWAHRVDLAGRQSR